MRWIVSGGLIVTLPGPDEDHNPETAGKLSDVLRANPDVPYEKRIEAARLIEDLTAGEFTLVVVYLSEKYSCANFVMIVGRLSRWLV